MSTTVRKLGQVRKLLALGLVLLLAVPAGGDRAPRSRGAGAGPSEARATGGASPEERGEAVAGLEFRENDPLAIEAYFPRESYRPVSQARLHFETSARSAILQFFHVGPESGKTVGNMELRGIPVSAPVCLGRISAGGTRLVAIGNWPTGLYFAQLTASGGRVGYAPFVVPPKRLGQNRVAIVLPTRTWQAYNFRDDNGDGLGDTWYATPRLRHGPTPPALSEPRRPAPLPQLRPSLPALAEPEWQAGRHSSLRQSSRLSRHPADPPPCV